MSWLENSVSLQQQLFCLTELQLFTLTVKKKSPTRQDKKILQQVQQYWLHNDTD